MQTPQMTAARAKGRGPHTYQSAVSTIDVRARPDVVYKLLLNYVWKQGAGQHPVAVTVQGDKYGEGCTRVVNGAVEEVVISAVPYSRCVVGDAACIICARARARHAYALTRVYAHLPTALSMS